MQICIGLGITTLRQASALAVTVTVPGIMAAPALAQVDQTRLLATRAAAPVTGGSAILSYDLRFSTDQVSWTVVVGMAASQTITGLAAGTLYFVQTRAVNAVGAAGWSASASLATVVAVPGNTALPVISGTATVGYTLSATNGMWTGSPSGFGYQWKRAGVAITGATAATYLLVSADVGATLTCSVTATNAGGSTAATSVATATIASSATVPAVMTAPAVTPNTRTGMIVTRAAAPADGGSAITSYDLRYNLDQATWVTLTGISAAQAVSGLADGTVYYVQTRAVNAVGAGVWSASGLFATFASVTAINADGWSAAVTAPPSFTPATAPAYVVAARAGYDSNANAITVTDLLTLTQRVRLPYPSQATLDTTRCALSDYLCATDSVAGVTNNSAEVSPKPIANWALSDHSVVANTIRLEVVAFHRNARSREEVAAVTFTATDGTTTVSQTVSTSVISGRAGDAFPVQVYQCDLDVSTLANPSTITVNAKVYPFIGGPASIADSTASSVTREFSPRTYRRDTALFAAPFFVYVDATSGVDATGVVSTTAATASATPCLTIGGAIKRLVAANAKVDGGIIRLKAGTHTLNNTGISATQAQNVVELVITRDPVATQASVILQYGGSVPRMYLGAAGGWLRISDLTFNRVGSSQQSGEATSRLRVVYDNLPFDNGSTNFAILGGSADMMFTGVTIANWSNAAVGPGIPAQMMLRGVVASPLGAVEGWLVLGCSFTAGVAMQYGTRTDTGSIAAFNRFTNPASSTGAFSVGGGATAIANAAFVGNLIEYASATASPALRVSADAAAGSTAHIVLHHNTVTGFYSNGRCNVFYDEGPTRRTHKLMSVRGNIWDQINTKSDVFRGVNEAGADASSAVGNWPYLYGVGCVGEFSQFIDANNGGIGTPFAQAYPGLAAKTGTSNTVRQDPLFTTYAGTTAGPTAGAGGGVYTIGGASPAKATQTNPTLRFDLAGATRSPTAASAGAYE